MIRKEQTEDSVSFRICFRCGKDWVAVDFEAKKSEFKELSKLDKVMTGMTALFCPPNIDESIFNLKRAKTGWKKQ